MYRKLCYHFNEYFLFWEMPFWTFKCKIGYKSASKLCILPMRKKCDILFE